MNNLYKKYSLIVAADEKNGIGINNRLPWRIPEDVKYFIEKTTGRGNNSIIMGRKTWDSIKKFSPLKNRHNIIISKKHQKEDRENQIKNWVKNFAQAIALANRLSIKGEIFIIGGSLIYDLAIKERERNGGIDYLFLTRLHRDFNCDCFFPWHDGFQLIEKSDKKNYRGLTYSFEKYKFKK